jgi:BirA family biotin operon repressor/biotin-[acetyl-CoA-carboxylase] ligase
MLLTDTDWRRADRPRQRVGRGVEAHRTIGSTNDRARELLDEPDGEGRAVLAEEQTAGRGRRGRPWHSPPGRNLTVSVAVRPRLAAGVAWQLAVAAGLAARTACAQHAAVDLKWPNDLVSPDGAKLGGLLVETTIDGERVTSAVVGIGINVNWRRAEMPPEIADGATSLADLAGRPIDRVTLLAALLDELDAELIALEAGRSPLARYRDACTTLGSEVAVETSTGRLTGRAVEVNPHGALVVDTGSGRVALATGDVVRLRPGAPA